MRCPSCLCDDCQRVEVAYAEAARAAGFEAELGPVRTGAFSSVTAQLRGRAVGITGLAEGLAPPQPPATAAGCLGGLLLVAGSPLLVAGLLVAGVGCVFGPTLPWGLGLAAAGLVGVVAGGACSLAGEDPGHAEAVAAWRRLWLCRRCGDRWEGPEPPAGAFRVAGR